MDTQCLIIMATYFRKNGKTKDFLKKSLNSIKNQSYTNWTLVIIGDKYEPKEELDKIIDDFKKECPNNKIVYLYNTHTERDIVKNNNNLWRCAGANAINMGLKNGIDNKYKYFFHLDDDDYWSSEHLKTHMNAYLQSENCVFVVSKSVFLHSFLPRAKVDIYPNNILPTPSGMVHSSFSCRFDLIKCFHDNVTPAGYEYPADATMLSRIRQFILENKQYYSIYIPELTCYHIREKADY